MLKNSAGKANLAKLKRDYYCESGTGSRCGRFTRVPAKRPQVAPTHHNLSISITNELPR